MKELKCWLTALAIFIIFCFGVSVTFGATYNSDGSASGNNTCSGGSIQYIHDSCASNGDKITMPIGTFTWTSPVTINKAIRLIGKGSGRIIGNTKTNIAIGTGSKTFTTTRVITGITVGQTLRIAKMPNSDYHNPKVARTNYMEGTVTSYTGTTLVMNITSTGGSGTYTFWWIATNPKTIVINNGANTLYVGQQQANKAEIGGIKFYSNGSTPSLQVSADAYTGPRTLIHDCWFQANSVSPNIIAETNRVLMWNCSFDDIWSEAAVGIQLKWEDDTGLSSWRSNSTMGNADSGGATNFYVEDCDFHAYLNAADWDGNARVVVRHCVFDNAGMTSHGADTGGPWGMRHAEIYDNELIFDELPGCSDTTLNVNWFFWQRGGTGVITDNILPTVSSCYWGGPKPNISFSVLNIDRNSGCYACWNGGYPAPHQVGQGFGTGAVFHTWDCATYTDDADYYTFLEPIYIWNNTGTAGNTVSLNEESDDCSGNGNQVLSNYVQSGRDYIVGTAKPGWSKAPYPHPARP